MKKLVSFFVAAIVCTFLINFSLTGAFAQDHETDSTKAARKQEEFSKLIDTAQQTGKVRVIVRLEMKYESESNLSQPQVVAQRGRIKETQDRFLNRVQSLRVDKIKQFRFIPYTAFETDAATLVQLQSDPQIVGIEKDELADPTLLQSTTLIGAPLAWSGGFSGAGQTIAILDTGVDKNHPFLSGKVVSEACYSTTYGASSSVCPAGVMESIAPDSGLNCASNISGCNHGTHVAGIAAGRGASFSGVAKDANIIAIQVFSRFDDAESCGSNSPVPCVKSYTSDQIRALERVKVLSASMNIAAVNMSLGGGQYASYCDDTQTSRKAAIDNLRAVGIATVIASGNSGYNNALGAPACISTAVSVGSTDSGSGSTTPDAISGFSNSAAFLTLLAPGRGISSSVLNNGFGSLSGTSMAAPHVAGAFAVLKQRAPNASVSQFINALTRTGQSVTDLRNGITKPRIRIANAVEAIVQRRNSSFDFDGDGKADVSVFRPSNGGWYIQNSSDNSFKGTQFGMNGDLLVPADFDGDGKTDVAVFRPSTGGWYILRSSDNQFVGHVFGQSGDIPVAGDFDGDAKADVAVFRPSNGGWYRMNSSNNQIVSQQFGMEGDKPQIGDFDGDSKTDVAVFRPATGGWYILRSSDNSFFGQTFGQAGDIPTTADFDGDGKSDLSVFRPSTGGWYRMNSSTNQFSSQQFGIAEDKPTAADYDGDGRADIAVFRPSTGGWYLQRSASGFTGTQWGTSGDIPTSTAFNQ